ncbi:MAG: cell division protein ZapB [Acidobacteria bacterium]|nr:cell division protein ZapB [Pyrinomonadaceae bacterium]MCC6451530.1 cell division protein ZapB [Acidobacteriota bacterium]
MNGLSGMEKFSHLEDKIYLTIELVKKLREDNERLEGEVTRLRAELSQAGGDSLGGEKVNELLSEREAIQAKVEAMLDALTEIDPEIATAVAG